MSSNYYIRPAAMDPEHSVSVFERGRTNEFGEPYCVLPCVTFEEAEDFAERERGFPPASIFAEQKAIS